MQQKQRDREADRLTPRETDKEGKRERIGTIQETIKREQRCSNYLARS